MNLRTRLRTQILGLPGPDVAASAALAPYDSWGRVTPQLASPFAPTPDQLQTIVWSDVLGGGYAPVTRAVAMGIPAVARMRHLLCGIIARMPLVAMTGGVLDAVQPLWTQRTDGDLPPYHRMLWTVDDHLFYGWSLWAARRGAPSDGDPLLNAARVPWHRWEVDGDGRILVDAQPVQADQAILIPGPHGGILNDSGVPLRMAADNLQAAANAARNPNPNIDLHYTGDDPEYDPAAIIQIWSDARRGLNGGVGFTNKWIEAKPMGAHDAQLLVEGRNADAVDMARIGSVPAGSLDATSAGASLTYETTEGRNQQLLDYGAQLYMDAIEARLSLDDAIPRGRRIAFDTSQFTSLTPASTGAPTSD